MRPQRLDITLAFKAISLSDVLSGTEKQVAAAIVDSFNFRTEQCDPSFDRIAHLIGKSRRTVIRAVMRLEKVGLLTKARHGGHFHRNAYQPNWAFFRSLEAKWKVRCGTRHWGTEVSHSTVPSTSRLPGDKAGTQTIPINQSKETSLPPPSQQPGVVDDDRVGDKSRGLAAVQPRSHRERSSRQSMSSVDTSSASTARTAAERRWHYALLMRLRDKRELYEQAVEAIDLKLQADATEAELAQKGAGVRHIFDQLVARGLDLRWQAMAFSRWMGGT